MVKFKLNILKKKTKIEVVDDAESMPGESRQYTRFKEHITDFEQAWNNTVGYSVELAGKTIAQCMYGYNFKIVGLMETDKPGVVLVYADSIEP
jgi:hypothetical protein